MPPVQPSATFPVVGHEVSATDWALIYGPLAVVALVFLSLLIGLWRSKEAAHAKHATALETQQAKHAAALELQQTKHTEEIAKVRSTADAAVETARSGESGARHEFFDQLETHDTRHIETVRALVKESHEMTRAVTDKITTELAAVRTVAEAMSRRVGRRE